VIVYSEYKGFGDEGLRQAKEYPHKPSATRTRSAPDNTRKLLLTHIAIAVGREIFCFAWGGVSVFARPGSSEWQEPML
jgi:hypothetical protein